MLIPAAMNIESAVNMLDHVPQLNLNDQSKEFISAMGASTCKKLGIRFPVSDEVLIGYRLGLQTARVFIRGDVALNLKGINPEDVL